MGAREHSSPWNRVALREVRYVIHRYTMLGNRRVYEFLQRNFLE